MHKVLKDAESAYANRWLPERLITAEVHTEHKNQLEQIRQNAEAEAASILAQARLEAEHVKSLAQEEGLAEGRETARQEYSDRLKELDSLITEVSREREDFFFRIEPELVRMSVAIAEKVLTQQLSLQPEFIVETVKSHLLRIRKREVLNIRANSADMPVLNASKQALINSIDGVREINFYDDGRVGNGSLVIEMAAGSLDARIPSQLDVINQAIEGALEVTCRDASND